MPIYNIILENIAIFLYNKFKSRQSLIPARLKRVLFMGRRKKNIFKFARSFTASILTAAIICGCIGGFTVSAENTPNSSITVDTQYYVMAPGDIYDIGIKLESVSSKIQKIYSSRSGIASVTRLSNGNCRVKGLAPGDSFIVVEVYSAGGVLLTHASAKITVAQGARKGGKAIRAVSWFYDDGQVVSTQTGYIALNEAQLQTVNSEFVRLVNSERAKLGIAPVGVESKLSSASGIRAEECLSYYSHIRPSGDSFETVLNQVAYRNPGDCGEILSATSSICVDTAFGGNGYGIFTGSDRELKEVAYLIFMSFKNSSHHYSIMKNPAYHKIGFSTVTQPKNKSGSV
jgi:uncharacterized protein YkwD